MNIKLGISSRHCHLTKEDKDILFGTDYELKKRNDLVQKNQFATEETVSLKTEKGIIENVRIIGPLRNYTQVEISKTDAYFLGIEPPIRESSDLENSSDITIIGNKGEILKKSCCIIPTRHIHLSSSFAKQNNFYQNQKVKVLIKTEKPGILENVNIKINDNYVNELHLDRDDANAFLLKNNDELEIINILTPKF